MQCGEEFVPRVWVIEPYRAGERGQVLALAEALGWPFEVKQLTYRKLAARTNLLRGSDLAGIRPQASTELLPPWPDLLITAGMRNEPVCRWVREQSGGRSRIVHIGRPWANVERFDLVVTTPQYRLPHKPSVLHNGLTLHRVTPARLAAEAAAWQDRLGQLPSPRIAVIAGGNSGPFTFGARAARRLATQAVALASASGGSLLVTTSSRTPPAAVAELAAADGVPVYFYRWRAGDANNPYFGYLALADEFIVTADSISMLSEACATGKPVHMFDLNTGCRAMRPHPPAGEGGNDFRFTACLYRALMRWGWQRLSRDITLVHRRLLETGRASWLGEPAPRSVVPAAGDDLQRAVARVRALFGLADC